jgi:hypothetical protein
MLYMSPRRLYAVEYVSLNGTYNVLKVVPSIPSRDWPVETNRDFRTHAIKLCDELDKAYGS